MKSQDFTEIASNLIGMLVVLYWLLDLIRNWRDGSPELRMLRLQVESSNQHMEHLIQRLDVQNSELIAILKARQ